jgi:tryptophan synthase beta chain
MEEVKILLSERETPDYWYNIQADLPNPLKPPINPRTSGILQQKGWH